jgi:hypothetical protein
VEVANVPPFFMLILQILQIDHQNDLQGSLEVQVNRQSSICNYLIINDEILCRLSLGDDPRIPGAIQISKCSQCGPLADHIADPHISQSAHIKNITT